MAASIPLVHYHVGVVTRDLDEGMRVVGETFGLRWSEVQHGIEVQLYGPDGPVDWGLRRVVHSTGGPMRVELLEGDAHSVWYTDQPAVLHHLAYWVDDVTAAAQSLERDGWQVEVTVRDAQQRPSMFAYLTKPGNARVELTDAARRDNTLIRLGWGDYREFMR